MHTFENIEPMLLRCRIAIADCAASELESEWSEQSFSLLLDGRPVVVCMRVPSLFYLKNDEMMLIRALLWDIVMLSICTLGLVGPRRADGVCFLLSSYLKPFTDVDG